jgi:EAL and modified HD-GYP domain-containing signal transduction protein
MEILVARQPVFDRREQLYGYDLVLRRPGLAGAPGEPLPEQLVADTFLGIGIDQVAAGHRAFVTVDRDMLISGAARLLPADRVVLQLSGRLQEDPELIQACDQMVWAGYRFSLSSDRPEELPEEFLRLAEIVKIDVSDTDRQLLVDLSAWLKAFHVRMLASNVSHRVERDLCTNLGFELFEGYKFTAPETLMRRDLPIEHMVTFRLLKLVRDSRATDAEIEELLRRDVALSYKLLRMVNSAAVGGRDIWSIGHALRLLGREQIARWLGLLLVTDSGKDGVRAELTHLTLVRARMCELLADVAGLPRARGSLFLVGMLSLLDRLLETPMELLAESMELAPDVSGALLRRDDFFGAVLALVEAYERGAWEDVDSLAAALGVGTVQLAPTYLEALSWANEQRANQAKTNQARAVR